MVHLYLRSNDGKCTLRDGTKDWGKSRDFWTWQCRGPYLRDLPLGPRVGWKTQTMTEGLSGTRDDGPKKRNNRGMDLMMGGWKKYRPVNGLKTVEGLRSTLRVRKALRTDQHGSPYVTEKKPRDILNDHKVKRGFNDQRIWVTIGMFLSRRRKRTGRVLVFVSSSSVYE